MGAVRAQAGRRWLVVALGTSALVAAPQLWTARPVAGPGVDQARLLDRIAASARVEHSGLAEIHAGLGLPDLPRFGETGALLGGATRARVWWAGPTAWRVDTLTPTGERDAYGTPAGLVEWDFEEHERDVTYGEARARLPRTEDLLPPQLARRVLAGLGDRDRVEALGRSRIAGLAAEGLRVRPEDPRSTVAAVEIWADPRTGLPLEVVVRDRGHPDPAIRSRFESLVYGAPTRLTLAPPAPADAPVHRHEVADLADAVDRFGSVVLPRVLAGEVAGGDLLRTGSVVTYGRGLVRFSVLAVPGQVASRVLEAARGTGGSALEVTGADALVLPSRLLTAVVAYTADDGRGYLLVGTVQAELLRDALVELVADPPPLG